ncbi:MAG: hypothetical protein ACRED3_13720 [Bradyrhizobium sp.]
MLRWLTGLYIGAALASAAPAFAQVGDEVVVVTGSRIASDDAGGALMPELPYISISVPADFVLFTVQLETATRSVDERERELEKTFQTLAARVTRTKGLTMEVGQPGNSSPLETAAAREAIETDEEDYDRSVIPLVLKFAVQPGEGFAAIRTRAEKFIEEIAVTGRVEAVPGDLQYIGVSEPKKHREALLRQIADDAKLLQTIFGSGPFGPPGLSLTGLEGRVKNRPIGPLEVEMYIPYSISLHSDPPSR